MRRSAVMAVFLCGSALAACTSTEQTLDPTAITPPQSVQSASPAVAATASVTDSTAGQGAAAANSAQPAAGQTAAVVSSTRVKLAPIVGATVEAATPLTERIAIKARERGIQLAGNADTSSTHVLKGYFSAITEGNKTTVIYVWDVLDSAGNRLHRIQGQMQSPAGRREGWASVSSKTMQGIADQTVDQLAAWLSTRAG
jgi:hypothetical protein